MKLLQILCWTSLLFVCCPAASAQDGVMRVDGGEGAAASLTMARDPDTPALFEDQPTVAEKPYPWQIAVYPALAWAPIFGTSVDIPPTPSHPIESSGTTDVAFNGAYFGGARVERNKWSGDFLFMWAAMGANRTTPRTDVSLDFVFGDLMVGYQALPGLYVEGGFRRLAVTLNATVDTSTAAVSPGYWDPLIGMTYRRQLGRAWRVLIHSDGGGFGVGSDVDVTVTGRGEWQFARHYGLTLGYGLMHLSESASYQGGTLHVSPTMHGPIIGFGLYF